MPATIAISSSPSLPASGETLRPTGVAPLTALDAGSVAVLQEVCDSRSCAVLRSLGLMGGDRFRLCRVGDPCIIQVRSTRIGLSRAVAESVLVAVADGAPV